MCIQYFLWFNQVVFCQECAFSRNTHFEVLFSNRSELGVCNCKMHNETNSEIRYNDGQWCCQSTSNECTVVEKYDYGGAKIVNCTGTSIPLTQQCPNEETQTSTCNFYPSDKNRNSEAIRSYIDTCNDKYDINICLIREWLPYKLKH